MGKEGRARRMPVIAIYPSIQKADELLNSWGGYNCHQITRMTKHHCTAFIIHMLFALCCRITTHVSASRQFIVQPALFAIHHRSINSRSRCISTKMQSTTATNNTTEAISSTNTGDSDLYDEENNTYIPPWSMPQLKDTSSSRSTRFRQHVNPLARRYQMSTDLPDQWPQSIA